jgi:hypothetical protein
MGIVARRKHATISGMISKRYPRCIVQFILKRDLVDADYHLNGVGRGLSDVRIAAQQLRNTNGREMADYHVCGAMIRTCGWSSAG